jgi:hypothetical protein
MTMTVTNAKLPKIANERERKYLRALRIEVLTAMTIDYDAISPGG